MNVASSLRRRGPWCAFNLRLLAKRFIRRGTVQHISVVDRLLFGPRCGIWALGFRGEILLVGVSEDKIELLKHYPDRSQSEVPVMVEEDE